MNKKYLYATKFYYDTLEEIEENSDIHWVNGEQPTKWFPPHILDEYIIIMNVGSRFFTLIYGDPDSGETVLNGPDFVKKYVELMPKGTKNE